MTDATTMRLRRITITCERRGDKSAKRAEKEAGKIAMAHGWTAAFAVTSACGCITLFRSRDEMRSHLASLGVPLSAFAPAPAGTVH